MLMPWNDSYNLGLPTIDLQHMELYKMLNQLAEAMDHGRGKAIASTIMDQLMPFIRRHFAEEEKTLLQLKSPAYQECRRKHEQYLRQIAQFLQDRSASDPSAVIDLLYFLETLLDGHIESDRRALEVLPSRLQ